MFRLRTPTALILRLMALVSKEVRLNRYKRHFWGREETKRGSRDVTKFFSRNSSPLEQCPDAWLSKISRPMRGEPTYSYDLSRDTVSERRERTIKRPETFSPSQVVLVRTTTLQCIPHWRARHLQNEQRDVWNHLHGTLRCKVPIKLFRFLHAAP